ncbi:ABC transporter ATP-binding protein [Mycoplasmatota bacterium]|nr:ABC transporter ATP-binding protein [Mycoplasmatota bacterium]
MRPLKIELNEISVNYGKIHALKNLNLTINEGDYIGIVGPNGGGKSTMMKSILGLIKPSKGKITYCGTSLKKSDIRMGYVPQISDINRMFPITVEEVVLSGRMSKEIRPFFKYSEEDKKAVEEVLDTVGLKKLKNRQINELSGGEFQKMIIARALTLKPDILLLDEPTAMVDVMSQRQIFSLIKKLSKDITIVLITHHVQMISKNVKKLIYLDRNIIAEGDPNQVYQYAYLRPVHQSIKKRVVGGAHV